MSCHHLEYIYYIEIKVLVGRSWWSVNCRARKAGQSNTSIPDSWCFPSSYRHLPSELLKFKASWSASLFFSWKKQKQHLALPGTMFFFQHHHLFVASEMESLNSFCWGQRVITYHFTPGFREPFDSSVFLERKSPQKKKNIESSAGFVV